MPNKPSKTFAYGYGVTTNNRMELLAIIALGLNFDQKEYYILSDSKYVIRSFTEWMHNWRSFGDLEKYKKSNSDLFALANIVFEGKTLKFTHVKGHVGVKANEFADKATFALRGAGESCLDFDMTK